MRNSKPLPEQLTTMPPADDDAERAALGSIMLGATIDELSAIIGPDDFRVIEHQMIARHLWTLREQGTPTNDLTLILAALKDANDLAADPNDVRQGQVTSAELAAIMRAVASPSNARHYAERVAAQSQRRQALQLGESIISQSRSIDVEQFPKFLADTVPRLQRLADRATHGRNPNGPAPILTRLADVQPEPITWLWPNRIAVGKLTLIAGDPGLGKSFLTLDLAARVTLGAKWPDDCGHAPLGSVVLVNCEDGLADTIRPRLDAAGADCSRVVAIEGVAAGGKAKARERGFDLSRDLPALETAIATVEDCRLVIIDPISAFCGSTDSHKNADVRSMLAPLAELAQARQVAVIAVTHLRKGDGAAIHRALGSVAFVAAARAAFCVVKDANDHQRRLFLPTKNNLGNDADGLAFKLAPRHASKLPCVEWQAEPVKQTADDAIAQHAIRRKPGPDAIALSEAIDWLQTELASGPKAARELEAAAQDAAISWRTVKRAKESLGVESTRELPNGPWSWRLPHNAKFPSDSPDTKELGYLGTVAFSTNETTDSEREKPQDAKLSERDTLAAQPVENTKAKPNHRPVTKRRSKRKPAERNAAPQSPKQSATINANDAATSEPNNVPQSLPTRQKAG